MCGLRWVGGRLVVRSLDRNVTALGSDACQRPLSEPLTWRHTALLSMD